MKKITELTAEQQLAVVACRERFFADATSTTTDRTKAEAAIAAIVEPALKTYKIHWCADIKQATSLDESLRDSLWDSLSDSLRKSLDESLRKSLDESLRDSLWDSLSDSLRKSLDESLRKSLDESLRKSLDESLRDSLWDSLWDSGWVAFYKLPAELELVIYTPEVHARLAALEAFHKSAFALWVLPGHVIVLENPTRVTVTDGKLVDIGWERAGE